MNRKWFLGVALLAMSFAGLGADTMTPEQIRQRLSTMLPEVQVGSVKDAPLPGYYEIVIGTQVVYLSKDGRFLLLGEVIDAGSRTNLTKARRNELVAERLKSIDKKDMIIISPDHPKRYITVFTDVDCPYCAKLHLEVPQLNKAGIEVRYLLFPRSGIGSRGYYRALGVWCAKDQIKAIGIAKAGGEIELKKCDNPIQKHIQLGLEVGVEGTPAIVVDDGTLIGGYLPAPDLIDRLGLSAKP